MILNVCENRKDTGMILINHMFLIDTLHQKTLLDIKCMDFSDKTKQFYSYFAELFSFHKTMYFRKQVP